MRLGALMAAALALAACTQPANGGDGPPPLRYTPGSGPWVVTAINYHFHDAHPTPVLPIGAAIQFHNVTQLRHNVTFPGTGYSENIRPAERLTIDPIADVIPSAGSWPFYCKFHVNLGMFGEIRIAAGD